MADFYLLANTSPSQMFGAVIKTQNKTVVIDGGTCLDCQQLVDFLKENSNLHVDAWFFTHPHHDHIGCFIEIGKGENNLTVDKVYHHFPDLSDEKYACLARGKHEMILWQDIKTWEKRYDLHQVEVGESFQFDDVRIRVLRVFNPNIISINDSSTVYRIDGPKHSILILGDLGVKGGIDTINKCPRELLITDYTQMAHHGQGGVSREFYEYITPKRCIWATPDWLWNNDRGSGFDSDIFKTVRTREWMEKIGVTEHFIEKDGIQKIEI